MRRSVLSGPYAVWMIMFTIFPLFFVAYYAFTTTDGAFTIESVAQCFNKTYLSILWRSVRLALECTGV